MSYDINIWSIKPIIIPENLPFANEWKIIKQSAYLEGKNWQIVLTSSAKVLEEDIPEEIFPQLPGIKFLTEVNLEPIGAPKSAYVKLNQIVKHVGEKINGIVEDKQSDKIYMPTGVSKYIPVKGKKNERFSTLAFTWLFTESPLLEKNGVKRFVKLLEKYLPEALPRRYGLYEPPQFKLEEKGLEHFIEFLEKNRSNFGVWYPTKPVISVSVCFDEEWGFRHYGGSNKFRANYVEVEIDSEVLNQLGWEDHLRKFWRALSVFIKPFYGDVRFLNNLIRSKTTYWIDAKSERHPIKTWWWKGVPKSLGQAIVIGEPYVDLWNEIKENGTKHDRLYFVSTHDWRRGEEVDKILGKVPRDIAQVGPFFVDKMLSKEHHEIKYPQVFPFTKEAISKKT